MTSKKTPDYTVGRAKPPKEHAWKPGQPGNPKGRAKEKKTILDILNKLLAQKVTVSTPDGPRSFSKQEMMLLQAVNNAAKGDRRMLELILKYQDKHAPAEGGLPWIMQVDEGDLRL
jgi:hypothetical protein